MYKRGEREKRGEEREKERGPRDTVRRDVLLPLDYDVGVEDAQDKAEEPPAAEAFEEGAELG